MSSPLLVLLLLLPFSLMAQSNRVYVHPFSLFSLDNVSCEPLQTQETKPMETVTLSPLYNGSLEPDSRDLGDSDSLKQNTTQRTSVLAELLNSLGLRMYKTLSSQQKGSNTLFSPVNTYGSLVTFYLGASKKTAIPYLQLLGLHRETDSVDCVSLVDGHKVLRTLQSINSLVDGPKDEIDTRVWTFARQDAGIAEDFVRGTQDFSDTSYIRAVDFETQEAEVQVNDFMEKTSQGRMKDLFKDLSTDTNLLFVSSVQFKGNWRTAFQPEKTSMQEFHVDEKTTVSVPLMTHTGRYRYLNDEDRHCTVVKLALSKRTYMLLVLPHEGANLNEIEDQLRTEIISAWYQHLKEGLLELSLPKFSMTALTDLRVLLTDMLQQTGKRLLGSDAEFERLSNKKPFSIDKVYNKVVFEMSEEGAETQDRIEKEGVPVPLTVNRPFFFSIVEGDSNAILMLGKVTNPKL